MRPICSPVLLPNICPTRLVTAPPASCDSEPFALTVPVTSVDSEIALLLPVAEIAPRAAVQLMSAFWISCGAGLLALPLKLRGAARSAASRIEASVIVTGAIMVETRAAGGSGGNCTSAGFGSRAGTLAARRDPVHDPQTAEERDRQDGDPAKHLDETHPRSSAFAESTPTELILQAIGWGFRQGLVAARQIVPFGRQAASCFSACDGENFVSRP